MKKLIILLFLSLTFINSYAQDYPTSIEVAKEEGIDVKAYGEKIFKGETEPMDNTATFACLESLYSDDEDDRKFYFKVYRIIAIKADGALSQVIGIYLKKYLDLYPKVALNNFNLLSDNEKNKFISFLGYEFYLAQSNEETAEYFFNKMDRFCNNCPEMQTWNLLKKEIMKEIELWKKN